MAKQQKGQHIQPHTSQNQQDSDRDQNNTSLKSYHQQNHPLDLSYHNNNGSLSYVGNQQVVVSPISLDANTTSTSTQHRQPQNHPQNLQQQQLHGYHHHHLLHRPLSAAATLHAQQLSHLPNPLAQLSLPSQQQQQTNANNHCSSNLAAEWPTSYGATAYQQTALAQSLLHALINQLVAGNGG